MQRNGVIEKFTIQIPAEMNALHVHVFFAEVDGVSIFLNTVFPNIPAFKA